MNLPNRLSIGSLIVSTVLAGCATTAPPDLIHARDAYLSSSTGLTMRLAPTEVYDAKKVLDQANRMFEAQGDSVAVRDYSYIAVRKLELADVKARTAADRESIASIAEKGGVVREERAKSTEAALNETRAILKDERTANTLAAVEARATDHAQRKEIQNSAARIEEERRLRLEAEAKLAGAMKDLATVAAVKEDARGVVITLNGSVLFASGKYALLETAKTRLNQVAEALKQQGDEKRIVVEGHTDNLGGDAINQPLSLNRATSVREYLLSRGVESSRITAVGMGSARPIADNSSAENRANNRRVEIVISASPMTLE